ncbi:MAG: HepT-like ribonuclease domain-containing protein [Nanoarchaeota archaeon]
MHDKEKIMIIIEDIEMYLKKLENMKIKSQEDLKNDLNFYASSMLIFSAINRIIDLGDEVVKEEHLGYPTEIKEIFVLLLNKKIINKAMETKLKDLIISRNKLAHRYGAIKTEDIFKIIKEIKIIKEFSDLVLRHIKK